MELHSDIFGVLAAFFLLLNTLLTIWVGRKTDRVKDRVEKKVEEIKEVVNGVKTELVSATNRAGLAEGNLQGRAELTKELGEKK